MVQAILKNIFLFPKLLVRTHFGLENMDVYNPMQGYDP